jgi:hypothetical protein
VTPQERQILLDTARAVEAFGAEIRAQTAAIQMLLALLTAPLPPKAGP